MVKEFMPEAMKSQLGATKVGYVQKLAGGVEEIGRSLWNGADHEQRGVNRVKESARKESHRIAEMSQSQRAGAINEQVLDLEGQQAHAESEKQRVMQMQRQVEIAKESKKQEMILSQEWGDHERAEKRSQAEAGLKDKLVTEKIERLTEEETERQNMVAKKAKVMFHFEKIRHTKYVAAMEAKKAELLAGEPYTKVVDDEVETLLKFVLAKKDTSTEDMERKKAEVKSQLATVEIESEIADDLRRLKKVRFEAQAATQAADEELTHLESMQNHRKKVAEMQANETMEEDVNQQAHNNLMRKKLGERKSAVEAEAAHRDAQSQIEATKMTSGLSSCTGNVKAQASIVGKRKELENEVESTLGINKEGDEKIEGVRKRLQISKVLFLLVILGCELDLFGFGLAFTTYWVAGQKTVFNETLHQNVTIQTQPMQIFVIHTLLFIGPTGYLLATMMYILWTYGCVTSVVTACWGDPPSPKDLREKLINKDSSMRVQIRLEEGAGNEPLKADNKPLEYNEFQLELCKEEIYLKFYHFLPMFRYYLLVKDPESADVESLFRVNGLSTFTIGFAQMACMTIGLTTDMLKIDFFIQFGIFAQCLNLAMTGVYFFTSFPESMKSAMSVEAFQYNARLAMQGEFTRYKLVSEQYSLNFGDVVPTMDLFEFLPEVPGTRTAASDEVPGTKPQMSEKQTLLLKELRHFRFRVMRDINESSHLQLNLAPFSTQQLFEWRAKLVSHQVVRYGKLAGI